MDFFTNNPPEIWKFGITEGLASTLENVVPVQSRIAITTQFEYFCMPVSQPLHSRKIRAILIAFNSLL